MKERVSATIEPETRKRIDFIMKKGRFRNISHVIEEAIDLLDKEIKKKWGRRKDK